MKIIAHRGASGYAPENTRVSILKGLELGCDGFEVDVQLAGSGEVVVFHDFTLERTTSGKGFLRDINLYDLKKLDLGSWFSEEFKGEKIMTLEELLKIVPENKILNIEIKVRHDEMNKIEGKVVEILKRAGRVEGDVIISSFNHRIIKEINKLEPKLKTGLLLTAGFMDIENYIKLNNLKIYSLHFYGEFTGRKMVEKMNEMGIKTYIWTVNSVEEAKILKDFGVTGIITNFPDKFRDLREV
ncbi:MULTISPECIES: glycerophosphodiester phosphodiesterase [Psychrilyobacter]|uniref:Glycerophosphodiester phosphodiesterase n=1 Tax=Psychrilyobacter piezotolerans TaxID=2293438 RepID=A0ABX9KD78_9FUSO|nr:MULTISPECIES: glycerophosphodiester phosphodiesterase family protein [Psychrilyobacter]MCS5422652.1 glycerophosphodiester phosphodiesterase [Psychrilyobacter sp. S5]NDI79168.1 glycerophosphodiester phosphodiesterase [Psychrilyobacter piezotolerans]RDE58908.1 glycerophosphodiester phosphodiesterase [Psychrilyobacter sp. S5]REI39455.1 glycerophosphodiester phosphodiesterase [Psychrilyobacter piezotolerans]